LIICLKITVIRNALWTFIVTRFGKCQRQINNLYVYHQLLPTVSVTLNLTNLVIRTCPNI